MKLHLPPVKKWIGQIGEGKFVFFKAPLISGIVNGENLADMRLAKWEQWHGKCGMPVVCVNDIYSFCKLSDAFWKKNESKQTLDLKDAK